MSETLFVSVLPFRRFVIEILHVIIMLLKRHLFIICNLLYILAARRVKSFILALTRCNDVKSSFSRILLILHE